MLLMENRKGSSAKSNISVSLSSGDDLIKGDMLYSVGFHRLSLIRLGRSAAGRDYFDDRLGRDKMKEVYACVLHGLNLGSLAANL